MLDSKTDVIQGPKLPHGKYFALCCGLVKKLDSSWDVLERVSGVGSTRDKERERASKRERERESGRRDGRRERGRQKERERLRERERSTDDNADDGGREYI